MKKLFIFICFFLTLPALAANDLSDYIYAKAMIGDVNGLRALRKRGYSLEAKDKNGNTAYCLAVFRRNQTAIRTLEMAGVDIQPRCMRKVPVVTEKMIYEAAHNGNIEQISLWQKYGVPVDLVDVSERNTALCQAVYNKDCGAIDILLKAGASEYHDCMHRIPLKVRQELDCKPIIIDWERVGLTAIGAGLVAGGVAVALSGGGSSGESCAINQHWDGEKCTSCPVMQCWDGQSCRVAYKGEYIDILTNRCMKIAPPPYTDGTYSAETIAADPEYTKGGFLADIKAANAYARGYSGYIIDRVEDNNFGQLTHGQSSTPGMAQDITSNRFAVGILSTGTEIENTPLKDSDGNVVTNSDGDVVYARYVNNDLAYQETTTDEDENETTVWKGNLAQRGGNLFGYNFDYGYTGVRTENQTSGDTVVTVNKGSQSWTPVEQPGGKIILVPTNENDRGSIDSSSNSYYSGSIYYFTGSGNKTQIFLVLKGGDCPYEYCGIAAKDGTSPLPYQLVDLKTCGSGSIYCLVPPLDVDGYIYTTEYLDPSARYTYKSDNPAPHYYLNESGSEFRSWNQGTMLAGIVAALKNGRGMYGVAYNAEVIPAVADIFRPITLKTVETLINAGSSIILQDVIFASNDSYPTAGDVAGTESMSDMFGTDTANAYQKIANSGTIFIVGTGTKTVTADKNTITNGIVTDLGTSLYGHDATISAGAPLANDGSALKNVFISVAAVEPNTEATAYGGYTLTKYSQPCGSTAEYCLSAPGGAGGDGMNLYSTVSTVSGTGDKDKYNWDEDWGTSAAAAVVAGSAAVLKGAYPHLSSQEIVALLRQTATPLGACAGATSDIDSCTLVTDSSGTEIGKYSTLYGWGLVNLDAATKPVGALWVNGGSTSQISDYIGKYSISGSSLSTSSVMSQNLANALPSAFTAFDSFNRPFAVNTKPLLNVHSKRKEFDDDFKAFMHGRDVTKVEANDQFSMAYAPRTSDRSSQMKTGLMEMDVNFGKTNFGLYYTEDTLNSRGNYFERALNNPFIQIQEAYGAQAKYNLTPKFSIGMSYAAGKNGFMGDGDKHYKAPENRISFVSTEATYQATKSVMFKASYGIMKEQESVLGMTGTGAFRLNGANTNFASAGVEIKPTDKFKLNLAYTYGWTTPEKSEALMNLSRLTADGFAAVAQYDLGSDNMLGLSVSSPLRVRSGKVSFNLPVGRSASDDTIYRQTFTGSMKPTARELDFALFYRDALTDALTIQSELGLRLNPDHQREANPDYRAMFGIKWDY